jgi:hypothetical protein
MHPNELYVRETQLGGRPWVPLFALVAICVFASFIWSWAQQAPRALGIEVASLVVLSGVALPPPCWRRLVAARSRYRARGLLPHRLRGLAVSLLSLGLLYGVVFPCWLAVELLVSGVPISREHELWWAFGYLVKLGIALSVARTGFRLLKYRPRPLSDSPHPEAAV